MTDLSELPVLPPPDRDDWAPERIGRRRFLQGVGAVAGAGVIAANLPAGLAAATDLAAGASNFHPLPTGVRVADTRSPSQYPFTRVADNHIRAQVAGKHGVPATATAAVLTVTAVNWSLPNFVTVFPTGASSVPVVSNLNLPIPGEVNANLVTVKIGNGGWVDVFQRVPCHVIVDVLGYYEPVDGPVREGRFVGLPAARRVLDTRPNNAGPKSFTVVDVTGSVPADASSVVINLTAAATTGPGFFTALPDTATTEPSTSSLNASRAGDIRAAGVIVPVTTTGGRRRIKIFTLTPAKLIVDLIGYFTGPDSPLSRDGLFVAMDPVRVLDTRNPGQIGKLWPNWVVEGTVPGAAATGASAIVANLTAAGTRAAGYLTISPARLPIPGTSNVNCVAPGAIVPNHVISPVTATHGFQVFSSHGAHVLVDLAGYFTGTPKIPQLAQYVNPPPPPAPPPWIVRVPRMGLTSTVLEGSPGQVTDSGYTWHWTGTGYMGQQTNVGLFGHRTEAGGPYRNLDWMQVGDLFTVTTGDAREYTYRMVRRDLTDANNENILAATRFHPAPTVSFIACTVGHDRSKSRWPNIWAPTSLKYRIIVTGELVSWREL